MTVLAPSAAEADALSTAFYLLGMEATAAYVAHHPEIAAIVIEPGETPTHPKVTLLGLSEFDFEPRPIPA